MSFRPKSQYWHMSLLMDTPDNTFYRYVNSDKVIALKITGLPEALPTGYWIEAVVEAVTERLLATRISSGSALHSDAYLALQHYLQGRDGVDV